MRHNQKLIIIGITFVAIFILSIIYLSWKRQDERTEQLVYAISAARDSMSDTIKQDTYTYVKEYLSSTDDEGNTVASSLLGDQLITDDDIQDMADNISDIVRNTMSDEVMNGATTMAVSEMQSQIEDLVSEKTTGLTTSQQNQISKNIQELVLSRVKSTLESVSTLSKSNQSSIKSNTSDLTKVKSTTETMNTTLSKVDAALTNLQSDVSLSSSSVESKLTSLEESIESNYSTEKSDYSTLSSNITQAESNAKAYTDSEIKEYGQTQPTYTYKDGVVTISIPAQQ